MRRGLKVAMLCLAIVLISFQNTMAQALDKGLILHLPLNNSGIDLSDMGNHGRERGNATYTEDRFGNACSAFSLDGRTSFISVPSSPSLNSPSRELSVSAWIRSNEGEINTEDLMWFTICVKGDRPGEVANSPHYRFQVTSKTVSLNSEFTENLDLDIISNAWYHFAMRYDGSTYEMYLNGEPVFEFPYSSTLSPNDEPLEIGRDIPGELEYHYGAIDDLRIYNRVLTRREIRALYNETDSGNGDNCTINQTVNFTQPAPDTVYIEKTDTVFVPQVRTEYQIDTVFVPELKTELRVDTVFVPEVKTEYRTDTVFVPQVQTEVRVDTLYLPQENTVTRVDTVFMPGPERIVYDTVEVEMPPVTVRDTVWLQPERQVIRDTVEVPGPVRIVRDTVYRTQRDTVYRDRPVFVNESESLYYEDSPSVGDTLVLQNVNFERQKPKLIGNYRKSIDKLIAWMNRYPKVVIRLEGHTDNVGPEDELQRLSINRARAVQDLMVRNGIPKSRIKVMGFGKSQPIASNETERGRKQNRRVQVRIYEILK